jgi:hypothetical protein
MTILSLKAIAQVVTLESHAAIEALGYVMNNELNSADVQMNLLIDWIMFWKFEY